MALSSSPWKPGEDTNPPEREREIEREEMRFQWERRGGRGGDTYRGWNGAWVNQIPRRIEVSLIPLSLLPPPSSTKKINLIATWTDGSEWHVTSWHLTGPICLPNSAKIDHISSHALHEYIEESVWTWTSFMFPKRNFRAGYSYRVFHCSVDHPKWEGRSSMRISYKYVPLSFPKL